MWLPLRSISTQRLVHGLGFSKQINADKVGLASISIVQMDAVLKRIGSTGVRRDGGQLEEAGVDIGGLPIVRLITWLAGYGSLNPIDQDNQLAKVKRIY